MNWSVILPILQLIWSAVSPELKQAALAELQLLASQETANPLLAAIILEAEKVVSAL